MKEKQRNRDVNVILFFISMYCFNICRYLITLIPDPSLWKWLFQQHKFSIFTFSVLCLPSLWEGVGRNIWMSAGSISLVLPVISCVVLLLTRHQDFLKTWKYAKTSCFLRITTSTRKQNQMFNIASLNYPYSVNCVLSCRNWLPGWISLPTPAFRTIQYGPTSSSGKPLSTVRSRVRSEPFTSAPQRRKEASLSG